MISFSNLNSPQPPIQPRPLHSTSCLLHPCFFLIAYLCIHCIHATRSTLLFVNWSHSATPPQPLLSVHPLPEPFPPSTMVVTEYEDLLSAGDTWSITKFPVIVHHDTDSANPIQIDLVQWMFQGRGKCHPGEVSPSASTFVPGSEACRHCTILRICTFWALPSFTG